MERLTREQIVQALERLDVRLAESGTRAQLYVVGGAVLCLVHETRSSTSRTSIKRLRGLSRPRFRLRVQDIRVFYDVEEGLVEVLAIFRSPARRNGSNEPESPMKEVPLSEVKDELSRFLRMAEKEAIVITRPGKPAGLLIGFKSEDDRFDYKLEHDPRFLSRVEKARQRLRQGHGVKVEELED